MIERVHPGCVAACTHQLVPDLGGKIVQRGVQHDRAASEAILRAKYPDARLDYLGVSAEHERHTWRLGGNAWKPLLALERTEGKQAKREVKYEHRPAVWTGTGHVDPVDFSRPAEKIEQPYPAPSLTSAMLYDKPAAGPAAALLELAEGLDWTGEITSARGCPPHATHGRPTAERFSEAVRLARGDARAVAVRMGGSWSSLWTWSVTEFFTRHATLEAFKIALEPVDNPVDNPSTSEASCARRQA